MVLVLFRTYFPERTNGKLACDGQFICCTIEWLYCSCNATFRGWFKFILMNIVKRVKAPSPKFFKVLRNIGLTLAAVGGVILTAPIALPVVIGSIGGYLAVVGGVLSAVSQLTTSYEENPYSVEDDNE
jgi:hypothetical protein